MIFLASRKTPSIFFLGEISKRTQSNQNPDILLPLFIYASKHTKGKITIIKLI